MRTLYDFDWASVVVWLTALVAIGQCKETFPVLGEYGCLLG